jgi:hypothetical protein
MRTVGLPLLVSAAVLGNLWAADATRPTVQLEVAQAAGGQVDAAQRWMAVLQKLPFDSLRVRPSQPGERPQIEEVGSRDRPAWRITAVLSARGELQFPDRVFRTADSERLNRWLTALRASGSAENRTQDGLSDAQRSRLRKELASTVSRSTLARPTAEVLNEMRRSISVPLHVTSEARRALTETGAVADELQGLSHGTALAALVRPAGLALEPRSEGGGEPELYLVPAATAAWSWPVGWPNDRGMKEAAPKLFDFLPVEIVDTPLSKALAALRPRLAIPLLIDHHAVKARQIDLDRVKVRYPSGRTFYKRLLDRLLYQAGLEVEVRLDEADHPLLWVRPIETRQRPEER